MNSKYLTGLSPLLKLRSLWLSIALWILWASSIQGASALDATTTRTIVDSEGNVGKHTSLALSNSGFPVISYYDDTKGDLKVAVCHDAACNNRTLTTVDSEGDVGYYNSLALAGNGFPIISYYDATDHDLKVAICKDTTCKDTPILRTIDSWGDVGKYTSLALTSSGLPVISYYDDSYYDLKVAVCNDTTCTSADVNIVDSGGDVGGFTSLALNSSDFPVISYYDWTNGDLKVAFCKDTTCTGPPTLGTIDSEGAVGWDTSLALNDSGSAVISYYDATYGTLKVVMCGDTLVCTFPTTVVDTGSVGRYISLVLNSNNLPVISYYDWGNGDLKVAACYDVICTTHALTIVDMAGDVGVYTAVALNNNGFPVISYHDWTNGDLKMAVCNICVVPTLSTLVSSAMGSGADFSAGTGLSTSLALNSSGLPIISYHNYFSGALADVDSSLDLVFCDDIACLDRDMRNIDYSWGSLFTGEFNSLALNSSGFPVISYRNENGRLQVAICNDATCRYIDNLILKIIDGERHVAWNSLALTSDDFPVISYYDYDWWGNGELKVAVCSDATCAGTPALRTIDSWGGDVGLYNSLALNANGFPIISYYDSSSKNLKVAVCNNATCDSATVNNVEIGVDVGQYTSLALNSSGFPVISYYDKANGDLKVAVCNDTVCGSSSKKIVDSGGDVGQHTSLALTDSGFPVISYYDVTNSDLKVAVCNDAICTAPTLTTVDKKGNAGHYTSLALTDSGFPIISYHYDYIEDDVFYTGLNLAVYNVSGGMNIFLPLVLK
jgi:hypothetical protein